MQPDIVTRSGMKMLASSLKMQNEQNRRLTMVEKIMASYLWSVSVGSQYPSLDIQTPAASIPETVVRGLIADIDI